jgi:hypothetical protein
MSIHMLCECTPIAAALETEEEERKNARLFSRLPPELIRRVIEYSDRLVHRNGKYLGRLAQNDIRRAMVSSIPRHSADSNEPSWAWARWINLQYPTGRRFSMDVYYRTHEDWSGHRIPYEELIIRAENVEDIYVYYNDMKCWGWTGHFVH